MTSERRIAMFETLEKIISADPGGRGIGPLIQLGDLAAACDVILAAGNVAIATGFFLPAIPGCETDGPPGAVALASAITSLGKSVCLIVDSPGKELFDASGVEIETFVFPAKPPALEQFVLVSIERPGRASDGRYYNMRGEDVTRWNAPIDSLFLDPRRGPTIGIGDGGNEIGMGKVHDLVVANVPHGQTIASVVATDHLLVSGVSNWGAWGLVAGLSLLTGRDLLPNRHAAATTLDRFVRGGARDGVTGKLSLTVDGLDLSAYLAVLDQLRAVIG